MKLSKKDISLLADAILKSVWDETARAKKLEAEAEKAWQKFKKGEKRQALMKLFDENPDITAVDVLTKDFYWMERRYYGSTTLVRRGDNESWFTFKDIYKVCAQQQWPTEASLRKEIELELTIQAIGGGEIKDIMGAITTMLKKKYDL